MTFSLQRFSSSRHTASFTSGVAAVEFALLLPAIAFIFAGTAEFGMASWMKFKLNSAVAAAANYAMQNASSVNSTSGATLSSTLASFVAISVSGANVQVVIDNGPTTSVTSGVTTSSGTATSADSCYCPSLSGSTLSWGSSMTCGASCTMGYAGKFVFIKATQTYTSLFANWPIMPSSSMTASIVLQVQ